MSNRLSIGISIISLLVSVLSLVIAGGSAYYTTARRSEELSVVFEETLTFRKGDNTELLVKESLPLVFINSGTKPIIVLEIWLHLFRRDESKVGNCDHNSHDGALYTGSAATLIKEKEVVRKEFILKSPLPEDARNDGYSNPNVSWIQFDRARRNYKPCVTFFITTASTESTRVSIEPFASVRRRPYHIWRKLDTIFDD